ncbi:MAG: hypothetical protein WDM81_01680 [Rhizomicrobium sp.]
MLLSAEPSAKRFTERLGHLFHEGYIDRPAEQWLFADARHRPATYELRTRTRLALREAGLGACPRTYLSGAHRQFQHSRLICEALASIELGPLGHARHAVRAMGRDSSQGIGFGIVGYAVSHPNPVRERRDPPTRFFGIEYAQSGAKSYRFSRSKWTGGRCRSLAPDARQSSYLAKLAAYQALLEPGRIRHTSPFQTCSCSPSPKAGSAWTTSRIAFEPGLYGAVFLFRSLDALSLRTPCTALAAKPWARIGHSPLAIGVP